MSTSDGTGIELFCFPHGDKVAPEFKPFNTGLFHFCIQDPNIEDLIDSIVAHGGKQRMPIREYYPKDKPFKMCYVEDPFGIVFEIYTHSYELTYSSGAYSE
jgi:catechol 2,3-dioxygenase-like lactoylglutathione lyase family enzyme